MYQAGARTYCANETFNPCKLLPDLPKVTAVADASKLTGYVLDAVANGKLSPVDAETISRSCEKHIRDLQVSNLESRLAELEAQLKGQ